MICRIIRWVQTVALEYGTILIKQALGTRIPPGLCGNQKLDSRTVCDFLGQNHHVDGYYACDGSEPSRAYFPDSLLLVSTGLPEF